MSSLRRLMKEATELTTTPSPDFHAAPTSDTNLYDWHFTLRGPPSPSPYSHGLYHGRIAFPPTYPLRPPSFRFLTPSGRFEVNREICLSISGAHEDGWQPAWGVRTALLAIRGVMGAEAGGQVGGVDVPDAVRRALASESRGWSCGVCGRCNAEILGDRPQDLPQDLPQGEGEGQGVQKESEAPGQGQGQAQGAAPGQEPAPAPAPQIQTATVPAQPYDRSQEHPSNPTVYYTDPWLDRAIIAVFFALVIMMMRRMLNADMADYY